MASMLTVALALALKYLHSSVFVYSSAVMEMSVYAEQNPDKLVEVQNL